MYSSKHSNLDNLKLFNKYFISNSYINFIKRITINRNSKFLNRRYNEKIILRY